MLVVDDEAAIRRSLSGILTDEGYEAALAEDGLDAGGDPAAPAPSVRAWRIVDAHVHEVDLEVIA